jgi:hypothetical protein
MLRFKRKIKIADVGITAIAGILSVCVMYYAVYKFGMQEAGEELILNMFYLACLTMIGLYFFNRMDTNQFNYRCSLCVGMTILLRDILFPPPLAIYALHVICLFLSVWLLLMLTFFYARKEWKTYTKRDLWMIFLVDVVIAALYNYDIYIEPTDIYTDYFLIEIWIRPTITYGLVACFVTEVEENTLTDDQKD